MEVIEVVAAATVSIAVEEAVAAVSEVAEEDMEVALPIRLTVRYQENSRTNLES